MRVRGLFSILMLAFLAGCVSLPSDDESDERIDSQVVAKLSRDLPGSIAALYRLRIPSTGGL